MDYLKDVDEPDITGIGGNSGNYKGITRIIDDPEEDRFDSGDILVTDMTTPEYTPLIGRSGAVVTDEGGITAHPAVVAREFDIPCIVGAEDATQILESREEVFVEVEETNSPAYIYRI